MAKNTITILIADPHAVTRAGIAAALVPPKGQTVVFHEVATAHEAVTYTEKHRPHIAIIEVNMPDMNGLIAARQMLSQTNTSTRVIVLTDVREDREMERASSIGVHGWLDKNSALKKLGEAVATVRAGQRWFDDLFKRHLGLNADMPGYGKTGISNLTDRETTVLCLLIYGKENKEIGDFLGISTRTVETYREQIKKKTNTKNTAELVKWGIAAGLIRK